MKCKIIKIKPVHIVRKADPIKEVCEWEYNESSENFESTCGQSLSPKEVKIDILEGFEYCPYCGKPTTFKASEIWKSKEAEENFYRNLKEARKKDMENKWIDLDIDNLPERFFTRDDIEIELENDKGEPTYWLLVKYKVLERHNVIKNSVRFNCKYRYRLKPLKSMQITKKVLDYLIASSDLITHGNSKGYFDKDGRKVEIID
jgi:hypothetical protein